MLSFPLLNHADALFFVVALPFASVKIECCSPVSVFVMTNSTFLSGVPFAYVTFVSLISPLIGVLSTLISNAAPLFARLMFG